MIKAIVDFLSENNSIGNELLIDSSIEDYVNKIYSFSTIITHSSNGKLNGLISYYNNDINKETAFLTMLVVAQEYRQNGIGAQLLDYSIKSLQREGFRRFQLEVLKANKSAIQFYKKFNFEIVNDNSLKWRMEKNIK
jgi:ribosomal protein S18 acetylase RimI-like enzyme